MSRVKCWETTSWIISEVLHTVCFLFKNEFVLQNTFTGLQCNLHCALSQRSNVWESLVFLSGRLRCWWVISEVLHTVCFLFKNEFVLQNTFTGLQYNLQCALSQRSNVWTNLVFLSERLRCWCVWLLRSPHLTPPQCFRSVSHGVGSSILGTRESLVGSAHHTFTFTFFYIAQEMLTLRHYVASQCFLNSKNSIRDSFPVHHEPKILKIFCLSNHFIDTEGMGFRKHPRLASILSERHVD
jgi:hypothetical protein